MRFLTILIAVGLVVRFWPYIVGTVAGIAVIVWLVRYGMRAVDPSWEREQAKQRRRAELAARADEQHAWVMLGDERGVYGEFPPAATRFAPLHGSILAHIGLFETWF
jgi:hypothetical protein